DTCPCVKHHLLPLHLQHNPLYLFSITDPSADIIFTWFPSSEPPPSSVFPDSAVVAPLPSQSASPSASAPASLEQLSSPVLRSSSSSPSQESSLPVTSPSSSPEHLFKVISPDPSVIIHYAPAFNLFAFGSFPSQPSLNTTDGPHSVPCRDCWSWSNYLLGYLRFVF
ncbi:hypothetical protein ILYODFUR_025494, partial [Ilyodon furcidens]